MLSLANLIPTVFRSGPGRLDAQGSADAFIDTSNVGRLNVPIHMVAVTIVNGQIQTVSDPQVIRLP